MEGEGEAESKEDGQSIWESLAKIYRLHENMIFHEIGGSLPLPRPSGS